MFNPRLVALMGLLGHLYGVAAITYSFPDCTVAPLKGNAVCDTTKDAVTRAKAIISQFTVAELINNTANSSPGVSRLGLPAYEWWSEALHGVAGSPGVTFAKSGNFSSATSFPQPITMGAAFDDELIKEVATVISTEARAFNNAGRAGIDFFTPNINPFKDPRWGRGQETPGEDPFHVSQYVFNLIQGLQGGIDPKPYYKVIADCKHFAAYDLENWNGVTRFTFDAQVSAQDMSEYYLPPFQSCVRDAKVASVMCSYNSVNGVPSCASSYLLQSLLRDYWGFNDEGRWVTSDCDAIDNIFSTHHFTADYPHAVADALKAGTDIDCGGAYPAHLPDAFNQSLITRDDLEKALVRQYSSLVRLGYFDPAAKQPFRQLGWSDVNVPSAQSLAYQAAVEGIVLLKNDGTLPFKSTIKKVAFIGPWANATTAMQGNYEGTALFLVSPFQGAVNAGFSATLTAGTTTTQGTSTTGFAAAIAAAQAADAIVFAGGIDETVEREALDRVNITWPGVQLDLISQLSGLGKPLVVLQFGGGQVDDTALKANSKVNAIVWGGYPGQSGGTALADILSGKAAPAARLPITQYPADYITKVPMTDMTIRPSNTSPGRTYKWYNGTPVFPFGHGLHYTTFSLSWQHAPATSYPVPKGIKPSAGRNLDLDTFDTFNVVVKNTGKVTSDYVALLFINGTGGPAPQPNKELISYTRLHQIKAGGQAVANLKVTLGSIARADANGNLWVYPGTYTLTVDTGEAQVLTHKFEIRGQAAQISNWPQDPSLD